MTFDYSEEEIQNILKSYKHKREKEKERYDKIKDTDEFKLKNRMKAKDHYNNNKDHYKEKYQNKKDLVKARNSFYYYKKKNDMEAFKTKYADRYELLLIGGYFKDWNPS